MKKAWALSLKDFSFIKVQKHRTWVGLNMRFLNYVTCFSKSSLKIRI
jgi:hypothetical protein